MGDTTIWAHSHLRFGQLMCGLKSSIMGYVPIFWELRELKSSRNSSRLKNRRCELSLRIELVTPKMQPGTNCRYSQMAMHLRFQTAQSKTTHKVTTEYNNFSLSKHI